MPNGNFSDQWAQQTVELQKEVNRLLDIIGKVAGIVEPETKLTIEALRAENVTLRVKLERAEKVLERVRKDTYL